MHRQNVACPEHDRIMWPVRQQCINLSAVALVAGSNNLPGGHGGNGNTKGLSLLICIMYV